MQTLLDCNLGHNSLRTFWVEPGLQSQLHVRFDQQVVSFPDPPYDRCVHLSYGGSGNETKQQAKYIHESSSAPLPQKCYSWKRDVLSCALREDSLAKLDF